MSGSCLLKSNGMLTRPKWWSSSLMFAPAELYDICIILSGGLLYNLKQTLKILNFQNDKTSQLCPTLVPQSQRYAGRTKKVHLRRMFAPAAPIDIQVPRRLFFLFCFFFLWLNAIYTQIPNPKVRLGEMMWRLEKSSSHFMFSALRLCSSIISNDLTQSRICQKKSIEIYTSLKIGRRTTYVSASSARVASM
jgi:hypothetical protein